ncbi:hypothetical protein SUDANB176_01045 [Streptomyces sp. enrichment culture]|uniref:hypothetical protein n=1 Tax=Streptomyces sp. enrichment culture TaxID=1795815 RepID=UPI003F54CC9C
MAVKRALHRPVPVCLRAGVRVFDGAAGLPVPARRIRRPDPGREPAAAVPAADAVSTAGAFRADSLRGRRK